MSFQDIGKKGKAAQLKNPESIHYKPNSSYTNQFDSKHEQNEIHGEISKNDSGGIYSQASDAILQYQKNVGLLENMVPQLGTIADGPVLETQYKVQVGVVNELGAKIEKLLRSLELNMSSMPRVEAAQCRATLVKLTRDFRTVEAKFKKLQLETKRRRNFLQVQQRDREDEGRNSSNFGANTEASMQAQIQMQENLLAEEIMKERQAEIRNINKGMHQVNEIYKDLAQIVGDQQNDIDLIETKMEESQANTAMGLKEVEKANAAESTCILS